VIHLSDCTFHTMLKAFAVLCAVAGAVELTLENWEEQTAGKTVLVKFQAPW